MAKATHEGTCQCCGKLHKLPNGRLSKHGYTVDWGFFNGVCLGAGFPPYELSCDLITECIVAAQKQLDSTLEHIEDLGTDTSVAWVHAHFNYETRLVPAPRDEIVVTHFGENDQYTTYSYKHPKAKRFTEVGQYAEHADMDAAILHQNRAYKIPKLQKQVKGLKDYISWQEERVANWKLADLFPL